MADVSRALDEGGDVPYVGFTNDTLAKLPEVKPGDAIECPHCGERHPLENPAPDTAEPLIMFYHCQGKPYVGAVQNRNVIGVQPDVSSGESGRMESKPMCWACWHAKEGTRVPTRLKDPECEPCWRCGELTNSGIFYLVEK
jgi:hypothetical protein